MRLVLIVLALLVAALFIAVRVAGRLWQARTAATVTRLQRSTDRPAAAFRIAELDSLPGPVARYLRAVVPAGAPIIRRATLVQRGEFLMDARKGAWSPFNARHHATVTPPGFVWDARISMAPGLDVRVRDGFIDGRGFIGGAVLGLFPVLNRSGTPEIDAASLHRWLGETVWYPTALLPSQGVRWEAMDNSTARATVSAGATTVWLEFTFGPDGMVRRVFTPARFADEGGRAVPMPWQVDCGEYAELGDYRLPTFAVVRWIRPEGPLEVYRGRVLEARFE
jgi:hypothetical protein